MNTTGNDSKQNSATPRTEKPYQLALVYGPGAGEHVDLLAESVVHLDVSQPISEALAAAGVTPADTKAKVVFIPNVPLVLMLAAYAGIYGYAGRHVEVLVGRNRVHMGHISRSAAAAQVARGEHRDEILQINGENEHLPVVKLNPARPLEGLTSDEAQQICAAKRLRLVPDSNPVHALIGLAVVCGLRRRRNQDRFPLLAAGGEDADADMLDLDLIRDQLSSVRRGTRVSNADALIAAREPSPRNVALAAAADVSVEVLLGLLGCGHEGDLWQCPRPNGHRNGDVSASMRVNEDNLARCYVHDSEPVDSLRLVMEVCGVGPDQAAAMLTGGYDFARERVAIAAERDQIIGA